MKTFLFEKELPVPDGKVIVAKIFSVEVKNMGKVFPTAPVDDLLRHNPDIKVVYVIDFFAEEKKLVSSISLRIPLVEELYLTLREVASIPEEQIKDLVNNRKAVEFKLDHGTSNHYANRFKVATTKIIEGKEDSDFDIWFDLYLIDEIYRAVYYQRTRSTDICINVMGEIGFETYPSEFDIKRHIGVQMMKDSLKSSGKLIFSLLLVVALSLLASKGYEYLLITYPDIVGVVLRYLGLGVVIYVVWKIVMFIVSVVYEFLFMKGGENE